MDTKIPNWLIVYRINQLICSIFNIFFGMLLSTAMEVIVQYEKTPCRLWYWLWGFNMWALHSFLQRAHGVLGADCNIWLTCWFSIRLTFSTSHVPCPRISAFYDQDCQRSSLRCTFLFTNGMRVICIIGEEDRIFFNCSTDILSVLLCMNCAVCVFRFHTLITYNYSDGSIQVWSKVAWAAAYVVLVNFLLLVTW